MKSKSLTQTTRLCAAVGLALASFGATSAAQAADTTRVIIEFKPGTPAVAAARSAIAQAGGRIQLELLRQNAVAVDLPARAVAALQRHAGVKSVEEDARRYPMGQNAPYKAGQEVPYGIRLVQADQLPEMDKYAGNMTVCVIDSGFDNAHEDLMDNSVTGNSDPGGAGDWFHDGSHHGTHVAGTIAAANNKRMGVVGVMSGKTVKLHIVKVFGDSGSWAYTSTLLAATNKCEDAGAKVINMSLGGGGANTAERDNFQRLSDAGILSVAAAGNGGNSAISYPAGYPAVVSVAGVDENKAKYTASQFNADVEIAGPAVSVLSTVPMGTGLEGNLKVVDAKYSSNPLAGSPMMQMESRLANFGLGSAVDPLMAGKVCLIQRGTITFGEKVKNCEDSGGIGAVIYNNVAGNFNGTLGTVVTTIPSVSVSDTDGAALLGQLGEKAKVTVKTSNYAKFDGTSMATPHVAAVAALVWSYFPSCNSEQIRNALNKSALDLGAAGRDNIFGYGLVQAKAAYDRLMNKGCGG